MKLIASTQLVHAFSAPMQVVGWPQASHSRDQSILMEELAVSGAVRRLAEETSLEDRQRRASLCALPFPASPAQAEGPSCQTSSIAS